MTTTGTWHRWAAPLLLAVVLGACGGEKEPAQKAIADAEAAISAIRSDAGMALEDVKALDDSLAALKVDFDRKDYKAVLAAAPALMSRVDAAQESIASRKTAEAARAATLTDDWNTLSTQVPEMVEAVNARVESLARTKKFPAGMNAAGFESTRAAAGEMTQSWQKALGAFANSNMEEAVVSAQAAKQKGTEVMSTLGMTPSS